MVTKTLLGLVFSLLLCSTAMAQSDTRGSEGARESRTEARQERRESRIEARQERRESRAIQAVPELDGNMAFLALGLMLAVGGLIREKRRTS